jgi:3-deoxy-D-manno-octulosonate 8-phosphate phosphatase (KDO 8-P phosphatase)
VRIYSRNAFKAWIRTRGDGLYSKWHLVCDVDGVLTDGKFHYSRTGKLYKVFGSHDADALRENSFFHAVTFVTADKRGFEISSKRVQDMGFQLLLKSPIERLKLIKELKSNSNVVYLGDSFSDIPSLREATVSAVPRNAYPAARRVADIRLKLKGGEGAVAELVHSFESNSQKTGGY